jgi:hypothetical protein
LNKKRISDLITTQEIKDWETGSIIEINAATGAGKSYFIKNKLYNYAKEHNQKILILVNRVRLKEQYIEEINRDDKNDIIKVLNYQTFESKLLYGKEVDFKKYKFIICDEYHYFLTDSNFNYKTDLFLSYILQKSNITRLFLSATSINIKEYIAQFIDQYNKTNNSKTQIIEYSIPQDYSYIESLNFYNNKETAINLLSKITQSKPKDKIIYFCKSTKTAHNTHIQFIDKSIFNCSDGNKEYSKFINHEKIELLIKEEKFDEQILITTTALDNGVNIIDKSVKHIIIDVEDVDVLIQCLGRKRVVDENDKVNVYIRNFSKSDATRRLKSVNDLIYSADYFIKNGFSKFVIKYPRQTDYSKIIFDVPITREPKYKTKRVNYIMYYKYRMDVLFYKEVLIYKDAYKDKISNLLNIKKYNIVETEKVKSELEIYLNTLINKKLYKEDKIKLIERVDLKRDGKLLRSYATLNSCFDELEIDYNIKSHKDYNRKLEDGCVNPNYKLTYWQIIHA